MTPSWSIAVWKPVDRTWGKKVDPDVIRRGITCTFNYKLTPVSAISWSALNMWRRAGCTKLSGKRILNQINRRTHFSPSRNNPFKFMLLRVFCYEIFYIRNNISRYSVQCNSRFECILTFLISSFSDRSRGGSTILIVIQASHPSLSLQFIF